jgi:hypothetical protein
MSGQLAPFGAADLANHAGGAAGTLVQAGAPSSWIPGQNWYNTTSSTLMSYIPVGSGDPVYNSADWVASSTVSMYIALLTATPFAIPSTNAPAIYVSDLAGLELTTSGYLRQVVTFTAANTVTGVAGTQVYPSPVSNTAALAFGPMTASMTASAQWAALIVSTSNSGNNGWLKYYWTLNPGQSVPISESIVIPAGSLVLDES